MYRMLISLLLAMGVVLSANAEEGRAQEESPNNFVTTMLREASQGNADAKSYLGVMYEKGIGVAADKNEAANWYREAARQGHSKAQTTLGLMYAKGYGAPNNEKEALAWFRKGALSALLEFKEHPIQFTGGHKGAIKAAVSGNPLAQALVGKMYLTGYGVTQDDTEAVTWLAKAKAGTAASGAHQVLGLLYEDGRGGLPKDTAEAKNHYRKAAEQTAADLESTVRIVYQFGAQ